MGTSQYKEQDNHIAVKAYQVPTCTGPRSPILLRLVRGRTPVATLGMWADPGRALSVRSSPLQRRGRGTIRHSTQSEDWRTARTSKISCAQTTHLSLAKLHREAGLTLLKPSPPPAGAICGLEPPAGPQPHFALTAAAERRRLLATPHHHSTHALSPPPS